MVFGPFMLGYDVKNGKITINLEGAELVRLIFHKYNIEKKGTCVIARELTEADYHTFSGNPKWSNSHILKILQNEKYIGDLVQRKTYISDYLTHAKKTIGDRKRLSPFETTTRPSLTGTYVTLYNFLFELFGI